MTRFLLKILHFTLFPLVLLILVEVFISFRKEHIFSEKNMEYFLMGEQEDYSWIEALDADSIQVLAGSSTVKYGLSCSALNKASNGKYTFVNIALDGRDPIQNYLIMKSLKSDKVTSVYFALDPWIYARSFYIYRSSYMYLDFSFLQTLRFSFEYDKSAFLKRYKNFVKFILPLRRNTSRKSAVQPIPYDFGSEEIGDEDVDYENTLDDWFQLEKYGWSELQWQYLKKTLDLCKARHIRFYAFIPPKRADFTPLYRAKFSAEHEEYVHRLVELGFSEPTFGYFDQFDKYGGAENFVDSYHLSRAGQKKYSEVFLSIAAENMRPFSADYNWYSKY